MKHITITNEHSSLKELDIDQLYAHFETITDGRQAKGKRYPLAFLLMTILLAKLSGQQKPTGITEWIRLRRQQLMHAFGCRWQRAPSLNTIRRTLADAVAAEELHQVCRQFLHQVYGGQQSELVVLDGKTMRGTIPKGTSQGVHLLAAYLPEEGIVLEQVTVDKKENEIVAAPRLLEQLNLRQKVVCGDAMFTQRHLSVQVAAQGGDYIWFVKDNQPGLHEDVKQFFQPPRKRSGWHTPPLPQTMAQTHHKGHGRLEQRTLTAIPDETQFLDWPCAEQVFKLQRKRTNIRTGVCSLETVYGVTSLPQEQAGAERLLHLTRSYWGIENGLHYRRDMTLQEDATRQSDKGQATTMATLNNFIVGLFSKLGFSNLASAQRKFDVAVMCTLFNLL